MNDNENAYHELICDKDENMCGLAEFPSITHSKKSFCMIERFIKDREAAWAARNKIVQSEEKHGVTGKTKGKQAIRTVPGVRISNMSQTFF